MMKVVEDACTKMQGFGGELAAGQATLAEFRQSSNPVSACQYILENSAMEAARFQARHACDDLRMDLDTHALMPMSWGALIRCGSLVWSLPAHNGLAPHVTPLSAPSQAIVTLREAIIREWVLHTPDDRKRLQAYLFSYILSGERGRLVVPQAFATIAVLLKRGWFEQSQSDHAQFFQAGIDGERLSPGEDRAIPAATRRRSSRSPGPPARPPPAVHQSS